ncbi:MAG: hypothetical protein HY753_07080 [Nitrospirae bacterium]|nr:hypothetical protein [Nitrospirota bacterium]
MIKGNKKIDTGLLIWEIKSSVFVGFLATLFVASTQDIKIRFLPLAIISFLSGPALYLLSLGLYFFIKKQHIEKDKKSDNHPSGRHNPIYRFFISAFSFTRELEFKSLQKPEEIKARLLPLVDDTIKWYQFRPPYQRKPYEGIAEDQYFSIQSFEDQLKIEAFIDKDNEMTRIKMKILNLANLQLASYQVAKPVPQVFESNQEQNIPPFQLAVFAMIVTFVLDTVLYILDKPVLTIAIITFILLALTGLIIVVYNRYYRSKLDSIFDKHISFFQELFR